MITFILRIAVAVVCAFWLGYAVSEERTDMTTGVVRAATVATFIVAALLVAHGLGVL